MSSDNEDYPDTNYGIDDEYTKSFKNNGAGNSEDGMLIEILTVKP